MREIRDENDYREFEVRPLTGALGAEIHGLDLRQPLSEAQREELLDAFYRYCVLAIPDQELTPEQHMEFGQVFGPLMDLPHIPRVPGYELFHQVRREANETTRVAGGNWHSDSTFLESPPAAIVMRAVDVPAYGGDTLFTSSYLGYETLSPAMQRMIEQLRAVHSATRVFGKTALETGTRYRTRENVSVEEGEREVVHPVVCTHPGSGRKHLFINRTYTQRFEGMTAEESKPLIDFLCDHVTRAEFNCRIRWRNNTVVIWDNRATMHRAVPDYSGKFRYLQRTTHSGQRPVLVA